MKTLTGKDKMRINEHEIRVLLELLERNPPEVDFVKKYLREKLGLKTNPQPRDGGKEE